MTEKINSKFVERYQLLFEKDKKSKVFAPLVEAYRKMGMLTEALKIGEKGVKLHPNFSSGRMALARIYLDLGENKKAAEQLSEVCELSPENILAHKLSGQTAMKLQRPKEALKSFKMVLFLNPNDQQAFQTVQKLESLTADEFEDDVFQMKPTDKAAEELNPEKISPLAGDLRPKATAKRQRVMERVLSLTDAFIVRNDVDKALQTLEDAENQLGPHPEFEKRIRFLKSRSDTESPVETTDVSTKVDPRVIKLEELLERVERNRQDL